MDTLPMVDLTIQVKEGVSNITIDVELQSNVISLPKAGSYCAGLNKDQFEGWWLILGEPESNLIHEHKRISLNYKKRDKGFTAVSHCSFSLNGTLATKGDVYLYLMSDVYLGLDQEFLISCTQ
jgi:hypothetical protein